MNKALLETYSDYLISCTTHATATGLAALLEGDISHDQVSRFYEQTTIALKNSGTLLNLMLGDINLTKEGYSS